MIDPKDLDDLVRISTYAGGDVRLAQGGGGNTSVKSEDGSFLWIKASGFRLAEVTPSAGWLGVSLERLNSRLGDSTLEALPPREAHEVATKRVQEAAGDPGLRPSLETSFHAWLPDRLVLHTHSIWANCFSCMVGGRELLETLLPAVWIHYRTPGYLLGKAVAAGHHTATGSHSYLLENHGWVTTGTTPDETIARHEAIHPEAERIFGPIPDHTEESTPGPEIASWAAEWERLSAEAGHAINARPASRDILRTPAEECPARGALVPDDVVYGIHAIDRVPARVSPAEWVDRGGTAGPGMRILWLEGRGFVLAGPNERAVHTMEENLLANVLLHGLIPRIGRVRLLPADEIDYLAGMDSEKYRREMATGKRG